MEKVPKICSKGNTPVQKLCWLRSQIIGSAAEFSSPFGKRRITYADATASARSLGFIEDYIVRNVLPFYGNTHTTDSYVGQQSTKTVEDAARYIKLCMGGGDQDAILFCGSGSTAAIKRLQEVIGIAVPSFLRDRISHVLNDQERWVVFVGPYEHHSNLLSWRQSLAEVVEIGLDRDGGSVDMGALRSELQKYAQTNRPMLGSFSACSNVTGIVSDTREIAALLHQYGAFACFDFAASGPYAEIKMRSGEVDGYDAVFVSPHKFIGGPGSPGILLMSKKLYQLGDSAPSTCGGGTVRYVNGFSEEDTLYSDNIEERENAGTPAIIQTIRAALAFWVKEQIGYKIIEQKEQDHAARALEKLSKMKNVRILGNANVKRFPILSFLIYPSSSGRDRHDDQKKPLNGRFVAKLLNDLFGIQARGGCACAGPYGHSLLSVDKAYSLAFRSSILKGYEGTKPAWTRISLPYYMSTEEVEFILKAIEFIAEDGHLFLPYYDFNFRNGGWKFDEEAFKQALHRFTEDLYKINSIIDNDNSSTNNRDADRLVGFMQQLKLKSSSLNASDAAYQDNNNNNNDINSNNKEEKDVRSMNMNMEDNDKDKDGAKNKYVLYWEIAGVMARLLSKFPDKERVGIPHDIVLDLPFRI